MPRCCDDISGFLFIKLHSFVEPSISYTPSGAETYTLFTLEAILISPAWLADILPSISPFLMFTIRIKSGDWYEMYILLVFGFKGSERGTSFYSFYSSITHGSGKNYSCKESDKLSPDLSDK